MRKKLLTIGSVLLVGHSALAVVYIQDPSIKTSDFQLQLAARSGSLSFAEEHFKKQRQIAANQELETQFLKINEQLKANDHQLLKSLNDIYIQRFNFEWSPLQAQIVAKVLNILASFEKDPLRQQLLLQDAEQFSVNNNRGNKKFRLKDLLEKQILQNFVFAAINGQKVQFDAKIALTPRPFRLSFYSDQFEHQSQVVTADQIKDLKLSTTPLLTGSCDTGFYMNTQDIEVLTTSSRQSTEVIASNCILPLEQRPSLSEPVTQNIKLDNKKPFIKKNWLWVGAGIIGSAIIYSQLYKDKERPTTRSGF